MTNQPIQSNDPYAPPPRYKEKSGGIVRYAILAALLGGGAFAYMQFANSQENASLDAAPQVQVMAETSDLVEPIPAPQTLPPVDMPSEE